MFERRWPQHAIDQTSRFWDAFVRGQDTAPAPDLAETIRQLHQRARTPEPSPTFAAELEATLMHTATDLARWPIPTTLLDRAEMPPRGGHEPLHAGQYPDAWQRTWKLLAAAVLLIAVIGSVVTGGQLWRAQRASLPPTQLPSLDAVHPATPPAGATPQNGAAFAEQLWETPSGDDKPFRLPMALAVDPQGNVWVADGGDDHFQILSPTGELLETWGSTGTGDGEFQLGGFGDIAFAADGSFYVADTANERVQQFAPDRTFVRSWTHVGSSNDATPLVAGSSVLDHPVSIAVAADGSVFVTDDDRDRIERFSAEGNWLNALGSEDGDGALHVPGGVAFDADGNVWVADSYKSLLKVFAPDGTFLRVEGTPGLGAGGLNMPSALAFDSRGRLIVIDDAVEVFDPQFALLGAVERQNGPFPCLSDLALAADDTIYVVDCNVGIVAAFRINEPADTASQSVPAGSIQGSATAVADGKLADQLWETSMGQDKMLTSPMGLALDPQGRIWVLDGADDRFQIFSPEGELLDTWGKQGTGDGQFDFGGIGDIAFASDGAFYVSDTANQRVQQFAPDRSFVRAWREAGNLSGSLASPATANVLLRPAFIDLAPDGSIYVSDEERNVVEHYTADGVWLNTLGTDSGDGRLNTPRGMAFDPDGNIWVADYGRSRLAIFAPDGTFLRAMTGINLPTNMEFDDSGHLLVVDAKGLLVMNQDLQPVGRIWRDQGMFTFLPAVAAGPDGRVYVADYNLAFLTAFQLRDPFPAPPTPTPAP